MISTRLVELVIDTVVCLTLAKWETVSGQFGGYLRERLPAIELLQAQFFAALQTVLRVRALPSTLRCGHCPMDPRAVAFPTGQSRREQRGCPFAQPARLFPLSSS